MVRVSHVMSGRRILKYFRRITHKKDAPVGEVREQDRNELGQAPDCHDVDGFTSVRSYATHATVLSRDS